VSFAKVVVEDPRALHGRLAPCFGAHAGGEVDAVVAGVEEVVEHQAAAAVAELDAVRVVDVVRLVDDPIDDDILRLEIHDAMEGWVAHGEAGVVGVTHASQRDQTRTAIAVRDLER
jgi:hypothetical protein